MAYTMKPGMPPASARPLIVLRCEDVPLRGLLADNVYQDLVGTTDPDERKRRIAPRLAPASPPTRSTPQGGC